MRELQKVCSPVVDGIASLNRKPFCRLKLRCDKKVGLCRNLDRKGAVQ